MQTETYDDLLRWAAELHGIIAQRLEEALNPETGQHRRWLNNPDV